MTEETPQTPPTQPPAAAVPMASAPVAPPTPPVAAAPALDGGTAPLLAPTQAQHAAAQDPDDTVKNLQAQMETETVTVDEAQAQGFYTFFAARQYRNNRFLVKAGVPVPFPVQPGMPPGVTPIGRREGDIFAQFSNSVLVTDSPEVIAWCRKHPQVCHDANDPRTKGWAALKEMQVNLANREIMLPRDVDVDEMLFPAALGDAISEAAIPDGGAEASAQVEDALISAQKEQRISEERAADTSRLEP